MSNEHKKYLKHIKIVRLFVRLTQLIILVSFLVLWQLLADFHIINTFISSSPKLVMNTIIKLIKDGNLFIHIWITTYETIISFIIGTLLGILIATLLWWNKFIARVIDPYLTVLNSLPKVALGPIIIIWSGAGMKSIILMALLISTIITIMNMYQSFIETDPIKIKLMQSLSADKFQTFFKLILPSSFKNIISTLKINVSMSLIGIIMGEFLVSKSGIGYLIMYGSQVFNLNLVITGVIILAIVAVLLYYLILYIEKKIHI